MWNISTAVFSCLSFGPLPFNHSQKAEQRGNEKNKRTALK